MQNRVIAPISGFLVFLVLTGLVLGYPLQLNLQSNLPAGETFTTFVATCTDTVCSSFVSGSERTIPSLGNLNVYTITGPGTVAWTELDYKNESYLPHIYRFQIQEADSSKSVAVSRNFQKKSVCEAQINKLELSAASIGENNRVVVNTSIQSAMSFPRDSQGRTFDFSMVPIPANLKDIYSTKTNVTLTVKDSNGQTVKTETKQVNPWVNKSDNLSFEFTPIVQGNHTIEISTDVVDPVCESANRKATQVNLTVTDSGPVANAGEDKIVTVGNVVQFDGSATVTSDNALFYLWDFGNGNKDEGLKVNYTYQNPGTYTVTLRVRDIDGQESTDTMIVKVNPINNFPVADFSASVTSIPEGQTVQFTDASRSLDGFKSRLWYFGDGTNSTEINPPHIFNQQGTYEVKLKITDNDNDPAEKTLQIIVTDTKPNPSFTSPISVAKGQVVTFTDTSTAHDGIKSRSWNFGDGTSETTDKVQFNHTYQQAGVFLVTLKVKDNDDDQETGPVTSQITVTDPQPPVPTTREISVSPITYDKSSSTVYLFDQVTVKANVSNNGSATESVTLKLKEGLLDVSTQTISLNSGETKEVSFAWTPSTTGSRTLTIESVGLQGEANTVNNVQTQNIKVVSVRENLELTFADPSRFPSPTHTKNSDFYIWVNIKNKGLEDLKDVKLVLDVPLTVVDSKDHVLSNQKTFALIPSGKPETYLWKVSAGSIPSSVVPKVYIGSGTDKVEITRTVGIQ